MSAYVGVIGLALILLGTLVNLVSQINASEALERRIFLLLHPAFPGDHSCQTDTLLRKYKYISAGGVVLVVIGLVMLCAAVF